MRVWCEHNGPSGLQAVWEFDPEVIILDIMLPGMDGVKVLKELRQRGSRVPVIMLTARNTPLDKIHSLDLGADDYLTKPFGADELLARVRAVLRRVTATSHSRSVVQVGDVRIDLGARAVSRGGSEVRLTPTEWALLALLAEHAGTVLDHRVLLGRVWGAEYVGDRNYLRTFIQRLRRKLEVDAANPTIIETIGRQGYRLGPMPSAHI